jgi:hypothetical protein
MRVANKEAQQFAAANDNWLHSLFHSQECKKYIAEEGENVAHADELFISDQLGYLYVRWNQGLNFKKSCVLSICYNSAKEMAVQRA